jgi:hypothetical protein
MSGELVKLTDPSEIEALPLEERGQLITAALAESKSWLVVATKATDPTPIAEFKAWAATVAEMTRQKGLAEEIQLDALEMVRRAERGIGIAIRNGQAAGEIRKPREGGGRPKETGSRPEPVSSVRSPEEFFKGGGQTQTDTYKLTDNVADDEFEIALTAARDEKNLARANVLRKVQGVKDGGPLTRAQKAERIRELADEGYSSRQIGKMISTVDVTVREIAREHGITIAADATIGKTRRVVPARVIQETVSSLDGLVLGLQLLEPEDYDQLDPAEVREWSRSLSNSMQALSQLRKELNRVRS